MDRPPFLREKEGVESSARVEQCFGEGMEEQKQDIFTIESSLGLEERREEEKSPRA